MTPPKSVAHLDTVQFRQMHIDIIFPLFIVLNSDGIKIIFLAIPKDSYTAPKEVKVSTVNFVSLDIHTYL